jgi:hypothetical protein
MTNSANDQRGHTLEQIARLLELDFSTPERARKQQTAANDPRYAPLRGDDLLRVCQDGERTAYLTRLAGYLIGRGTEKRAATRICLEWNARNDPPLPEAKVRDTVESIARTHEKNHPPTIEPGVVAPLFDLQEARVDRFLNCDPPPREWLLVDCLPLGKVGLLVAPGGTGKSQLALQLAVAVATGGMLADWWQVGAKGRVLALFAEEDEEELHRRVSAILRGMAFTSEQHADLRKNLFIRSMTASDNLMTKAEAWGSVTRTPFAERLCATVKDLPDLKLIVIDPVSRFRGGNENDAEDATRFVEAAELIAKKTGATVLLLHHTNKASTQAGEQHQGAARGSSALTDGVRFQMNLAALTEPQADELCIEKDSKHEYITVKVTKSNYAPAGGTVCLHRGDHGVLTFHEPRPAQSAARTDRIAQLVGLVRDDAARGHAYSKSSLAKRYGGTAGRFKMGFNMVERLISETIAEGFLTQGPAPLRILQVTGKPTEIAKAKVVVPAMSMEADEAAHGPENGEESKT